MTSNCSYKSDGELSVQHEDMGKPHVAENCLLQLVSVPDGLEDGEARKQIGKSTERLGQVMPGHLKKLIHKINASDEDKISCVLADLSIGFVIDVAVEMGVPTAAFWPASVFQLVVLLSNPKYIDDGLIDENGTPLVKDKMFQLSPMMPGSTWFPNPLPAYDRLGNLLGNFWPEDPTCLQWLDQQSPASVIYVAFGSFTVFDEIQFQELALGLELTNRPFLWVVREDITKGKHRVYPQGFIERVGDRGRMVSWAPQGAVLEHSSIACFLSHCGWNSTIEGVSNGVPFLCWPYFGDQFLNESYICDIWKIGLKFESDERGVIGKEEIKSKVEQLVGDDDSRTRAVELKQRVTKSVGEDGSSDQMLKDFVECALMTDALLDERQHLTLSEAGGSGYRTSCVFSRKPPDSSKWLVMRLLTPPLNGNGNDNGYSMVVYWLLWGIDHYSSPTFLGSCLRRAGQMASFRDCLEDCELQDLGYFGRWYTWECGRTVQTNVRERLDRAVCTSTWRNMFSDTQVYHLDNSTSDHWPLLINTDCWRMPGSGNRGPKLFRYEANNATDPNFVQLVQSGWSSTNLPVPQRLSTLGVSLGQWQHNRIVDQRRQSQTLSHRLQILRSQPASNDSLSAISQLQSELNQLLTTSIRRRQYTIAYITDSLGVDNYDDAHILWCFTDYFQDLFSRTPLSPCDAILQGISPCISADHNNALIRPFTADEIKVAVFQMPLLKAPGPDGFHASFYQSFLGEVGTDITNYCHEILNGEADLMSINLTTIVLILKVQGAHIVQEFRLISLCNVIYKIVSKVLVNCFKHVLDACIDECQIAFVPGRLITDNALIAAEALDTYWCRRSGRKGFFALKLDMSKAYDRVGWDFLEQILCQFGFHDRWVSLLMRCVRGSAFPLFLFCMEGLSSLLRKSFHSGQYPGGRLSRGGPAIHHLLFADDCLLYGRALHADAACLLSHIRKFQACSGQRVNFAKSKIFYSANTDPRNVALFWPAFSGFRLLMTLNATWGSPRGGLGIRYLELFNQAFLCKRLLHDTSSLVARVLRTKYFPDGVFLTSAFGSQPSYPWLSLWGIRDTLKADLLSQIVNGLTTSVFTEYWVPNWAPLDLYNIYADPSRISRVSDLIDSSSDRQVWRLESHGHFTVRSAYRHLLCLDENMEVSSARDSAFYRLLWSQVVPAKIQVCLWRIFRYMLPCFENLFLKHVAPSPLCFRCETGSESILHAIRDCPKVQSVWDLFAIPCVLVLLWALWGARNRHLHQGRISSDVEIHRFVMAYLSEACIAPSVPDVARMPVTMVWHPPPPNCFKVNFDGSFDRDSGKGAIGVVLRDPTGGFVSAVARFIHLRWMLSMWRH
ncbi:putative UDP-Glycosyltransferase superfamily protein [Hibiscus syriacus]|uniref:UDP-Glycosyltransferase superfamily protein n=1 Tax=Hibiscus syriacus TaxID=106335 RepID=A0A6A2Y1R3_HIBSY|nr:putative UDP-Glycosyltransferase superfamily protein [Hibiscus syriacus]